MPPAELESTTRESEANRSTTCPVCGSPAVNQVYAGDVKSAAEISFTYSFSPEHCKTLPVYRCATCSHVFCWPLPDDVAAHYEDVVDEEYLRHAMSRRLAAQAALASVARYQPVGRLLDVGCATGDFLEVAREAGYAAEGLELSHWSASIARSRGFTVHEQTLSEMASTEPGGWDLITLWGVIEHFARPREEMDHLASLLRPGGVLALWTGDIDSSVSRLMGRRWWYWQGQHIQYFSRASMTRLAQSAGLTFAGNHRYPFAATSATIENSLRRYPFAPLLMPAVRAAFAIKPTWYLRLPGEMLFVARRLSRDPKTD